MKIKRLDDAADSKKVAMASDVWTANYATVNEKDGPSSKPSYRPASSLPSGPEL